MKLWITGGEGVLGRALQSCCATKGISFVASSRQEADLTQSASLLEIAQRVKPTHIINCAAYTDVDGAEKESERAFAVNAEGPRHLARAALTVHARLVHLSTDYVFNGSSDRPYREEDLCDPINVYGESKRKGEQAVLEVYPQACVLRTSWLFGSEGKNFISSALRWIREKEKIEAVADQTGCPTYVHDLAEAILQVADAEGVVHFANGGPTSRYQLVQEIRDEMIKRGMAIRCSEITPVSSKQFPTPAKRPGYSALATERFAHLTGKQPRPWKEALVDYLTYAST
jgi:dTDP-4-dehydrorhamnose reductase